MAHQHELSILKALADAVVHRKFGANFIKFKAHGNHITNLAPTPYLMWRRTDGVSPRFIETESTYPQGIGLVCPWSAVSPYGERGPLAGGHWPLPIYNSHATVFHRVDTSCECTLLTDKAHIHAKRSKGLAAPLGDDPVNPENPQSDEAHRAASGTASPAGPFDRL
jgi:hypothetical protein